MTAFQIKQMRIFFVQKLDFQQIILIVDELGLNKGKLLLSERNTKDEIWDSIINEAKRSGKLQRLESKYRWYETTFSHNFINAVHGERD